MVKHILSICLLILLFSSMSIADPLSAYDVRWDSPSQDCNGSMPIGNGDIGMNVWAEQNGDVVLLISKTDSWSENGALLKLGKVRLSLSPNPFKNGNRFEQTLHLRQGEITLIGGTEKQRVSLHIWADANRPVIHCDAESQTPFDLSTKLEVWRDKKRQLKGPELVRAYGLQNAPFPVYAYPDTVCDDQVNQIVWYHRNQHSIWENNLKHQGLGGFMAQSHDPLTNLTFGGCIQGTGLESESPILLSSTKPLKSYSISIYPFCSQTDTANQWLDELNSNIKKYSTIPIPEALAEHHAWWDAFWNRSWIFVSGTEDASTVTRGYVLQRWVNACAGRGKDAIKFNGSIFTVDGDGFDADFRRWGGCYWWQNTRLIYWPMLASGDFDMMQPLFSMYQAMLPLEEYRTIMWYKHTGAFIGETVYSWGMYNNENYGWKRPADLPVSELTNHYIRREYTASLELLAMMADYYQFTQDDSFLHNTLLPMSDSLLDFWDKHYKTDPDGKMHIYPAQALETLQDALNPTTDIAGMNWVLSQLLKLDPKVTGQARQAFWKRLLEKVPPLPIGDTDHGKVILGAEKVYGGRGNSENPELYAVFPFRLFGIGKPELELARNTFEHRTIKGNNGWRQDETQAAFLGLTDTAKTNLSERANNKNTGSRFPAFWGPNFDWIPDQDHGSNLMKALQTMLMQSDNGKIYLRPSWPKEWNVDFKLHAPQQTIVEGSILEGKITSLKVIPHSRKKDVVILPYE